MLCESSFKKYVIMYKNNMYIVQSCSYVEIHPTSSLSILSQQSGRPLYNNISRDISVVFFKFELIVFEVKHMEFQNTLPIL